MKISKELIERYLQDLCSREEREAVDQWLTSTAHEETSLSEQALENMSDNIWASLEVSMPSEPGIMKPQWWAGLPRLAAAACLTLGLIGLSFFFVQKNATTHIAFSSYGMDGEIKDTVRSIAFSLKPNSSVNGNISNYGNRGYLNFTGSLKVFSEASTNLEIDFGIQDQIPGLNRKAVLEGGQLYYVGILKQVDSPDEILVLNSEQMEDLPPRIKIMAFDDFDI